MLGVCGTTVVTEYFPTNVAYYAFRNSERLSIRAVVSMSLDAARGLQVWRVWQRWFVCYNSTPVAITQKQGEDSSSETLRASQREQDQESRSASVGRVWTNNGASFPGCVSEVSSSSSSSSSSLPLFSRVAWCRVSLVRLNKALHEVGCVHVDLKPMQLLVDDNRRVMVNDFNSVHVMGISPTDGTFCPVQTKKRNRLQPWPSPENYAGQVRRN